jgi:transposase
MTKNFPIFKPYTQHQIMMLPLSLDELFSKDHPVRVVNDVINTINIEPLIFAYKSTGC